LAKTNVANAFTVGGHSITNDAAGTIPLQIKGASGQSTQLFELLRNDNALLFRVRQGGQFGTGSMLTGTNLWVNNDVNGASIIGAVIRGAASQSANLQEWQNSGGTARARVDASGNIFAPVIAGINQLVFLREENSGGLFESQKLTAAAANPGASKGKIYFRDGTNAGTLKLVVRAGAAGAETTILDNIPQ
jgi:hypothetical protein